MALPGETEAGSAGKQPCPGIVRRAHRDDDHGRGNERLAPTLHPIGSKDPDALKIPARRAASTLTRSVRSPVLAEPAHVLVPPSNHASGGRYTWQNEGTEIAEAPQQLIDLASKKSSGASSNPAKNKAAKFEESCVGTKFTSDEVGQLLRHIPSDDREVWWKVGAAIKSHFGEDGYAIWCEWSRTQPEKYDSIDQHKQWRSIEPGKIKRLFRLSSGREGGDGRLAGCTTASYTARF